MSLFISRFQDSYLLFIYLHTLITVVFFSIKVNFERVCIDCTISVFTCSTVTTLTKYLTPNKVQLANCILKSNDTFTSNYINIKIVVFTTEVVNKHFFISCSWKQ